MRRLSLQRRMVAASVVLALVVGGVFIAMILALSDMHDAREQEARSKEATASAFVLQSLVLDLMLPRLGGLEVLARLRADEHLREVPVLVITAWNETREDVIAAGAAEFTSKPFDPDVLKASIERLLEAA